MWEYSILRWIIENVQNPVFDWFFKILTLTGEMAVLWFALAFIMLFFKKTRKAGIVSIFAIALLAGFNNIGIKYIFERPRPFNNPELGGDALWLSTHVMQFGSQNSFHEFLVPSSWSFVSGHTMSSFLFGFIVAYYHKEFAIPALILSALMSFSRMYFGFHYLTDIIGGVVLAFLGSWLSIFIANKYEKWFINLWLKIKGIFVKNQEV